MQASCAWWAGVKNWLNKCNVTWCSGSCSQYIQVLAIAFRLPILTRQPLMWDASSVYILIHLHEMFPSWHSGFYKLLLISGTSDVGYYRCKTTSGSSLGNPEDSGMIALSHHIKGWYLVIIVQRSNDTRILGKVKEQVIEATLDEVGAILCMVPSSTASWHSALQESCKQFSS